MVKRGREFNEIYDLTAMRVTIHRTAEEGTRDCYGALGLIHSLWKPMPGRFKDYIAMPKLNGYRALHTTVIGPSGRPLEIQIRTREMHATAELGVAAHWAYKRGAVADQEWLGWMRQLMDTQADEADPREFMKAFRTDLFDDEVYVFTPKGEVKSLPAGATPIDFAAAIIDNRPPEVDGITGLRSLAISYGFLEAERLGRAMPVDELMINFNTPYQMALGRPALGGVS